MASTADFRNGMTIRYSHGLYTIVEFQHVKPGKGAAFVRTKLKNVSTGKVLDNTFRSGEKVDEVRLERRDMQYLYKDSIGYTFMDKETYEQITLGDDAVSDVVDLMKESVDVNILFDGDKALGIELPIHIELEIKETGPADKGDTASGSKKPAVMETGCTINVPFFVMQGELIKIDTRKREYVERVKK